MPTVMLVDLSSLYYPEYHARTPDIGGTFRAVVERVHKLAAKADYCGIGCDSAKSFRKVLSPEYKANRTKDAVATDQIHKVQTRLLADGFCLLRREGFEADDVIATAALVLSRMGHEITIATADKDLCAMVADGTASRPGIILHNITSGLLFDEAAVFEKLGVPPMQVRDFLALVGDKADNVPGVRGVGKVTAAELLGTFDDIDRLTASIETVTPPGLRSKLTAAIADGSLAMSRKLVTLVTEVPGLDCAPVLLPRVATRITADDPEEPEEDDDMPIEESISSGPGPQAPQLDLPTPSIPDLPTAAVPPPVAPQATGANGGSAGAAAAAPPPTPATPAAPAVPVRLPVPPGPTTALVVQGELIVPSDPRFAVALEPRTARDARTVGKWVFESRLFTNIPNEEAATLVIMMGRSLGIDAMTMLRNVHIIEGKIAMHAALIVGLILKSGKADYFKCVETSADKATWKTHRRGDPDLVPTTLSWTIEQAKLAQLAGMPTKSGKPSQWDKMPDVMLRWRSAVALARMAYPDVVSGLYSPDELGEDMPAEPVVGAA